MCWDLITQFFASDKIAASSDKIKNEFKALQNAHFAYVEVAKGKPKLVGDGYATHERMVEVPFGYGARILERREEAVPIYKCVGYEKPDDAELQQARELENRRIKECRQCLLNEYQKLRSAFREIYADKSLQDVSLRHKHALIVVTYAAEYWDKLSTTNSYNTLNAAEQSINRAVKADGFSPTCEDLWRTLQNEPDLDPQNN